MAAIIPNNLPLQLSSFIGREREIAEVTRLLSSARLVTLTGAGGCGKTRLALEVASVLCKDASAEHLYRDGLWLVEFAALADEPLVPRQVADALGVHEAPGTSLSGTLGLALQGKRMLLLFDNCEHLIDACARLAELLLRSCAGLRILATSREALRIEGEVNFRVPSLSLPASETAATLASLTASEAARLFVSRAANARPEFTFNETNADAIAQICVHLDGMALAIELAAARLRSLSVEQVAGRLADRFSLLTTGSRTALPRQQTLQATIDWSYDLLTELERILLRRVSVFAGGWTLEAAEAVCVDSAGVSLAPAQAGQPQPLRIQQSDVLDLLTRLADKSLVVIDEEAGSIRYRMLETIRQYAHEKLAGAEEERTVRDSLLSYFVKLAEAEEWVAMGSDSRLLERQAREVDNLRTALRWAEASGQGLAGLRLADALGGFWYTRDYEGEGLAQLKKMLAMPDTGGRTRFRASALIAAGWLEFRHGRLGDAHALLEESLTIAVEIQDRHAIAWACEYLGNVVVAQRDYSQGRALLEQSVSHWRALEDWRDLGRTLVLLGELELLQARYVEAQAALAEAIPLLRSANNISSLAWALRRLGQAATRQGDQRRAATLCQESLTLNAQMGDKQGIAASIAALAGVAAAHGQTERAAQLFAAVEVLLKAMGRPHIFFDGQASERNLALVRAALDPATFEKRWAEGRGLTLDQAIAEAMRVTEVVSAPASVYPTPNPAGLTGRELDVLRLLVQGLTDAQIAETLVVSVRTVNSHLRAIYSKLDVTSRTGAVRAAQADRLV